MREHILYWFEYVPKHPPDVVAKKYIMQFCHCFKRGCGRLKGTQMKTIRKNIEKLELNIDIVYDKMKWKERIHNPDLNSLRSQADDDMMMMTMIMR